MTALHRINRRLKGLRRNIYGLRQFIPGLKEIHKLELMVGPLGYWKELQAYQLKALVSNGMKPEHKLLDIGCGPLQGGIAFIKYLNPNNYFGFDIRQESVDAGTKLIKKHKLEKKQPVLFISDNFGMDKLNGTKFNFIWASQILYYFDEQKLNTLMKWLTIILEDDGKFLGDIIGPAHYEFKYKEHNWYLHDVKALSDIAVKHDLKVYNMGEIKKYGYPGRLSLRTNNLIMISKS